MIKVAITGNIASGKSQFEKVLREKGFAVVDTDEISHQLLKDNIVKNEIISAFGEGILIDGEISRKKLAEIVFNDEKAKRTLENIIHPKVNGEVLKFFEQNSQEKFVFVAVPQLFETGMQNSFDKIILICADDNIRLERLMKRNHMSLEMAQKRLSSQMSQGSKQKLCDFVIENNTSIKDFTNKINDVIDYLFSLLT